MLDSTLFEIKNEPATAQVMQIYDLRRIFAALIFYNEKKSQKSD